MPETQYTDEGSALRRLARQPHLDWYFSYHSQDRMREYGISRLDVQSILRKGAVINLELNGFDEIWTCQGKDSDNRLFNIVVNARTEVLRIEVITVIDKESMKFRS